MDLCVNWQEVRQYPIFPPHLVAASITFVVEWVERVAVSPKQEGTEEEVLFSLDLLSDRGSELVRLMKQVDQCVVNRVTTRAQAQEEKKELEADEVTVAREKPKVKPLSKEVGSEPKVAVIVEKASEASEVLDTEGVSEGVCEGNLGILDEEEVEEENLGFETDSSEDDDEELYEVRKKPSEVPELVVPPVKSGSQSRAALVAETKVDPSLEGWRKKAEKGEDGLVWKDGLLFQSVTTHVFERVYLMVLPKSRRLKVLELAHEKLGHMGSRRVKALVKQKFVWPGMGVDVIKHCRSCVACQKSAKTKARKEPMVERAVMSEPFEVIALDLVGPFPKGTLTF